MAQPAQASASKGTRPNGRATLFIIIFFALVLMALILQSPLSKIRTIDVVGAHALRPDQLRSESGLVSGVSFWKVNAASIRQRMMTAEPMLASVDVHVNYLTRRVAISVGEKKVVAIWHADGTWYRILDDGTVLDALPPGDMVSAPIITTSHAITPTVGRRFPDAHLDHICGELAKMTPDVIDSISEIHDSAPNYYSTILYTRDGYQLEVSGDAIASQMPRYVAFRKQLMNEHVGPGIIYLDQGLLYYNAFPKKTQGSKGGTVS